MRIALEGIDHVVIPVPDLAAAAAPFERLGLKLTPTARHAGMGTENRVFFSGSAESLFYVELIGIADAGEAAADARGSEIAAATGRGGLLTVMLRVRDFATTLAALSEAGLAVRTRAVRRADGSLIGSVADLDVAQAAGLPISLIQYDEPQEQRFARYAARGLLDHALPLRRLDHVAASTGDPARAAAFWSERLGVEAEGGSDPAAPAVLRLKIGDARLHLLGQSTSRGSAGRASLAPPPLVAFEVPDLDAATRAARSAGFSPAAAAASTAQRSRTADIPASETGGIGLALVQYLM